MARILVVEDESIVALDIQSRLGRMGFEVPAVAATGAEALAAAESLRPDLVLMDILLQEGSDGVETAAILRDRLDVPVVFLTAHSDEATLNRAKLTGPHGYVLKPFKDRELYTTIEVALTKHQNERRLRQGHAELELRVAERTAELARVNEELRRQIGERQQAAAVRAQLEDQLRQAQKMEALGRLAGGVAHDFNNMLTIINGYSELILDRLPAGDPLLADVTAIREAGERAAGLTAELLAFGRRQVLDYRVLDLAVEVPRTCTMVQRLIGEDIELTTAIPPGPHCVKTDPEGLVRILINLAANARDAMPQGGRLEIEVGEVELDAAYAQTHLEAMPGRYVRLRVRDSGCGMSEEVRVRIFEPFFTTKPKGQGSGLGLSVVYGVVNQSGGHVEVVSAPGAGTTVDVYLPRQTPVVPATTKPSTTPEPSRAGTGAETVLLVEDDDVVRELARRILLDRGYRVLEARRGEEALVVFELHDGPLHLLLTDVVMPHMSGRELADLLRRARPDLKVLYISGYTDDTVLRYGVERVGVHLLQKPFAPEALAAKVRLVLDQ
ncbi:MAG: response regulator [Candidatus Latescibacterota bacterium]|jgi:signal transduction histidine kinase